MPKDSIPTIQLSPLVVYSDENFPQKEYQRLKDLQNQGQKQQVINELKARYQKDKDLAYELAYKLNIDLVQELDIVHYDNYKDTNANHIVIADYNPQSQELNINLDSNDFNEIMNTIKHYATYKGNLADTLMAGVSGIFGSMSEGAKQISKQAIKQGFSTKIKALSLVFKAEGISVSAAYGYGNNDRDMTRTLVGVTFELGLSSALSFALATTLGLTSAPALIVIGGISAVLAGILLNTQAGEDIIALTSEAIKPLIENIKSKLQSFFNHFDSNPSSYELIRNPSLESKDYKSLIELLLQKDSTAQDIDTLLHSFPNYLKQDSNPKDPLDSLFDRESPTFLFPNTINYHRQGEIRFTFQILDRDYKRLLYRRKLCKAI